MTLERFGVEGALRTIQKSLEREVDADDLLSAIRVLVLYLQNVERDNTELRAML